MVLFRPGGQGPRFNEAGADAPEIPWKPNCSPSRKVCGFNEAGADAPEIPPLGLSTYRAAPSFNEAGADAPEIPPGVAYPTSWPTRASMRPGRMPRKYRAEIPSKPRNK